MQRINVEMGHKWVPQSVDFDKRQNGETKCGNVEMDVRRRMDGNGTGVVVAATPSMVIAGLITSRLVWARSALIPRAPGWQGAPSNPQGGQPVESRTVGTSDT